MKQKNWWQYHEHITQYKRKKTGMITKWHKTSCCNITDQINYDMSSYVNNIHNVNWVSVRIKSLQIT